MRLLIKWVKIAFINAFVFCLLLLSIEISVRVFAPQIKGIELGKEIIEQNRFGPTHGLKANLVTTVMGAKVVTNAEGFRIDPGAQHREVKTWVLFLGDSITMPVGIDASYAYPFIIDRRKKDIGIVNTAVAGYDFPDYIQILKRITGISYDAIFIGISINDIRKTIFLDSDSTLNRAGQHANWFFRLIRDFNDRVLDFNKFFRAYSRSYLLLISIVTDKSKNYFMAEYTQYQSPDARIAIEKFFQELALMSNELCGPVYLSLFPYEYQLRKSEHKYLTPQQMIRETAENFGFIVFDFYDALLSKINETHIESKELFLFNDPMHFSDKGNIIVADIILSNTHFSPMFTGVRQRPRANSERC